MGARRRLMGQFVGSRVWTIGEERWMVCAESPGWNFRVLARGGRGGWRGKRARTIRCRREFASCGREDGGGRFGSAVGASETRGGRARLGRLPRPSRVSKGTKKLQPGGRAAAPGRARSGIGHAQHGDGTRAGGPGGVPRQGVARGDARVSKHDATDPRLKVAPPNGRDSDAPAVVPLSGCGLGQLAHCFVTGRPRCRVEESLSLETTRLTRS